MGSDQKIKVCHLASGDLWAGAEVQVFTLLSQLNKSISLEISAIILNDGELFQRLIESGINAHLIAEQNKGFFQILSDIETFLKEKQIDLIHSHRYKENILAAHLKKRSVIPHIVQTIHGEGEPFKGINKIKAIVSTSLNRYHTKKYFDQVITVSEDIKKQSVRWLDANRMTAIHNSIDLQSITPTKSSAEMKAELGIEPSQIVIGTAGRLVPVKGYDILLESARIICDSSPDTVFILAGDGPLRDELETKCKELGLADNFKFLGFRKDIINLLNMFDLFVMSSHNEGIPIILLEAMSLSKPVVSTSVGGMREVVADKETGYLVKSGDPQAISEACLDLMKNTKLREEFGNKGKASIEAEFQVTLQAERISSVYKNICGK